MAHDHYPDALLRGILRRCRTFVMVGACANWNRPSFFAMKYLRDKGYRILPVNPKEAGGEILGQTRRSRPVGPKTTPLTPNCSSNCC